jgi:hypothetical protein
MMSNDNLNIFTHVCHICLKNKSKSHRCAWFRDRKIISAIYDWELPTLDVIIDRNFGGFLAIFCDFRAKQFQRGHEAFRSFEGVEGVMPSCYYSPQHVTASISTSSTTDLSIPPTIV